jgi:DNA-directed RNA polymerase
VHYKGISRLTVHQKLTTERWEKNVERMVANFGASRSPEGQAIIRRHLGRLIDYIAERRKERPTPHQRGRQKSLKVWLYDAMEGIDDEGIALAVVSGGLNNVLAPKRPRKNKKSKPKPRSNSGLEGILDIGLEVWRQCRGAAIYRANKKAYAEIQREVVGIPSIRERGIEERKILRKYGVAFPDWKPEQLYDAGSWGYDCLTSALPDIFPARRGSVLAISESESETIEAIVRDMKWRHPWYVPSEQEPSPWTDEFRNDEGLPFAKARDEDAFRQAMKSGTMSTHVNAVNYLQSIEWTLHKRTLDFVIALAECLEGRKLIKKHKGDWVERRGFWNYFRIEMEIASSLVGTTFWLPHTCDFRGRVYQVPHLNYIGRPDYIRALFRFARGEAIGTWGLFWLKTYVAKLYNGSRETFQARHDWAEEHLRLEKIQAVAADPMAHLDWIKHAHDPVQFVAACFELSKALEEGPGFITHLPVPFDAACSGAQMYALLGRNKNGAKLTNLEPSESDEVECLYEAVRGRIETQIASAEAMDQVLGVQRNYNLADTYATWWKGKFDRKLFKMMIMISGMYGAGEGELRRKVYKELLKRGGYTTEKIKARADAENRTDDREVIPRGAVNFLLDAVEETLENEKIGAPDIRLFLEDIATALAAEDKPLAVNSPSGFPFVNLYKVKLKPKRMQRWLGDKPKRNMLTCGYGKFYLKKHSPAPNFIHMLDSAFLAFVANACEREGIDLVTIHDCFGCLASRAERLREILLEQLYELCQNHDPLGDVRKSAARALGTDEGLPRVPPRGDFDIEQLRFARYAFS